MLPVFAGWVLFKKEFGKRVMVGHLGLMVKLPLLLCLLLGSIGFDYPLSCPSWACLA